MLVTGFSSNGTLSRRVNIRSASGAPDFALSDLIGNLLTGRMLT